jgi:copper type II ascorbate-dependent monooxygenase-like protein
LKKLTIDKHSPKGGLIVKIILLFTAALLLAASSADREVNSKVTFNRDIAPIFFQKCAECHRPGESSPFSVLSYKEVRPWAKSIREKVISREMPPWHADPHIGQWANDRRLGQKEIDTIVAWVDGGTLEGDPEDLPPQPQFVEGWRIGKPDLILSMPDEFTIAATGPDEYQYFTIDPNFKEDHFVQAVEARPGNRKVVHHIVAFIQMPMKATNQTKYVSAQGGAKSIMYRDGFLQRVRADAPAFNDGCRLPNGGGGWIEDGSERNPLMPVLTVFVPGGDADLWGDEAAMFLPAGAKLILQVHYSKTAGSVQKDRSSVGFIFAKKPPNLLRYNNVMANLYIKIPPGEGRHRSTACWNFGDRDVELSAIRPHMHLRGTAMEVKVFYPDGREEVLLNVPNYDFWWQENYRFKNPVLIPTGSTIRVTGYFDNSSKNKLNPDPTRFVRWGDPTSDEMLAAFLEYTQQSVEK